jgi:hypothetical protein
MSELSPAEREAIKALDRLRETEQREQALREALDNLGEAIERVSLEGDAGDMEDLDIARHDAQKLLTESADASPPTGGDT